VLRCTVRESDPVTALGQRSECRPQFNDDRAEYWDAWEFMLDPDWSNDRKFTVYQIHESPDGGDAPRAPQLVINANIDAVEANFAASMPTESTAQTVVGRVPLKRGYWYSAVLHANWQIDSTGFIEMWVDDRPLFKLWNRATHYDDVLGPWGKIGVYDYFHVAGWGQRIAYFANYRRGDGAESYFSMTGRRAQSDAGIQVWRRV